MIVLLDRRPARRRRETAAPHRRRSRRDDVRRTSRPPRRDRRTRDGTREAIGRSRCRRRDRARFAHASRARVRAAGRAKPPPTTHLARGQTEALFRCRARGAKKAARSRSSRRSPSTAPRQLDTVVARRSDVRSPTCEIVLSRELAAARIDTAGRRTRLSARATTRSLLVRSRSASKRAR